MPLLGIALGQGQVISQCAPVALHLIGGEIRLTEPDCPHLGANQGAIDLIEIQYPQPRIIAGQLQIAIQNAPRRAYFTGLLQIHQQKGQFTLDIDPTQGGIELDAIENEDLPLNQGDVTPVHVPMALAYEAIGTTLTEKGCQLDVAVAGPGLEGNQAFEDGFIRGTAADHLEIG